MFEHNFNGNPMTMKASTFARATPAILILCWFPLICALGIQSLFNDHTIRSDPCGQRTHMWKYAAANTAFCFCFILTYLLTPRGGEGARARATLCMILFGALGVWGTMLCTYMSLECDIIISNKFKSIKQYVHVSTVHNYVFCVLFFLHEACAASWLEEDLTLVFEVEFVKDLTYDEPKAFATPVHHVGVSAVDSTSILVTPPSIHVAPRGSISVVSVDHPLSPPPPESDAPPPLNPSLPQQFPHKQPQQFPRIPNVLKKSKSVL